LLEQRAQGLANQRRPCRLTLVTLELEDASLHALKDRHVPVLIDLMTGGFEL